MHTFARPPKVPGQALSGKSATPAREHPGQDSRASSILHLQRTIGNQAVQAKLAINEPGDRFEQDADRIADQVMRTPEPGLQRACACGGECPDCRAKQESLQVRRVQAGDAGQGDAPSSVHDALRSPGQPLDPATRAFMEPRFGQDFSQVRVHTDAAAEASAREVNAHAYAVGHDVVFGAGRFAPGTQEGRRLIAHELAHTVQQSGGAPAAVARQPKEAPFAVNQQDMVSLQNTMLRFYGLLSADDRASLQRNTTVVIALVTHENQPTLVYTVASNSTSPGIRAAADRLGLTRWDPEGIADVAGERHAEQLTLEGGSKLGFKVHGMAVTREPCADCGPVVAGKGIPIVWVRDPNPPARTPSAPGGPPAGGVPPAVPPRSSPAPAPATTTTQPAATTKVTAEVGAPLQPVNEATPGFNSARGAAIGGAAQLLQSRMFGNLQQAEVARYEKRVAELQPKIDGYLSNGYSVELVLIVEKPNRPDLLCVGGVFCDQGQLVYFRNLYISLVESVEPVVIPHATAQTSIWPRGGRDGFVPYTHQGGSLIEENEIPYLSARDSEHHCEYKKLVLYPQKALFPLAPKRPPAPLPVKPKPRLDPAARLAKAMAPSEIYMLSANIVQAKMADRIEKRLAGHPSLVMAKNILGGGMHLSRTSVNYRSDLDKPRAEALAEIVRAEGVASARVERSGDGNDDPGTLQIFLGRDAEEVKE